MATIFFDLGDTLVRASWAGDPPRLRLEPFDFAAGLLARLREAGHRLGIISNTGDEAGATIDALLAGLGLRDAFDDSLCLYSHDFPELEPKPEPDLFDEALHRSGAGERTLFVGDNAAERATARAVGFETTEVGDLEALLDA